jgi:hypothetical protein
MNASLIAKLAAAGLAGIMSLSILAGIDALATHEGAGNAAPALLATSDAKAPAKG